MTRQQQVLCGSIAARRAIEAALDETVADESAAIAALTATLGERVARYATTTGGMLYGTAKICAAVERIAMETFAKKEDEQ